MRRRMMGEGGGARRQEGGMVTPKGIGDGTNGAANSRQWPTRQEAEQKE
jgi:hypothetical protein